MTKTTSDIYESMSKLRPAIDAAHERANLTALLEHARMGRAVCESRDGEVVWIEAQGRVTYDAELKPARFSAPRLKSLRV